MRIIEPRTEEAVAGWRALRSEKLALFHQILHFMAIRSTLAGHGPSTREMSYRYKMLLGKPEDMGTLE
jgi:hypothetical protein